MPLLLAVSDRKFEAKSLFGQGYSSLVPSVWDARRVQFALSKAILVIDGDGYVSQASIDSLMGTSAVRRGIKAFIINGAVMPASSPAR